MKHSITKGISFGLTSGIITTLGLIVGLHSSTHSVKVVIGGILVIAIADSLSDSLGIHISEEASRNRTQKQVWVSTGCTFASKMFFASIFIIPFLFFNLSNAIWFSIILGLSLIAVFSYYLARSQKTNPVWVIGEHVLITVLVILATHTIGDWIGTWSG